MIDADVMEEQKFSIEKFEASKKKTKDINKAKNTYLLHTGQVHFSNIL